MTKKNNKDWDIILIFHARCVIRWTIFGICVGFIFSLIVSDPTAKVGLQYGFATIGLLIGLIIVIAKYLSKEIKDETRKTIRKNKDRG